MERYLRFGYWSTLIGGLLLLAGAALTAVNANGQPFSEQVVTSTFAVATSLRLLGVMAMIIGFAAIAARQSSSLGRFGLVAYGLAVANLVLQAGWMFSDLFVTSVLAARAPDVLDGTGDTGRLGAAFLIAWLMNVSIALFGVATLRARVLPRTVGWSLVAAGLLTLVPLPFDGPVYEVMIGAAVAIAGWSLRKVAPLQLSALDPERMRGRDDIDTMDVTT